MLTRRLPTETPRSPWRFSQQVDHGAGAHLPLRRSTRRPSHRCRKACCTNALAARTSGCITFRITHFCTGPSRPKTVRAAFQTLIDRHDALRTSFVWDGDTPRQIVHAECTLPFVYEDWSDLPDDEKSARWEAVRAADGLDLGQAPLMRCGLYRWSHRPSRAFLDQPSPRARRSQRGHPAA